LLLTPLLVLPASAFVNSQHRFFPEDLPLQLYVADDAPVGLTSDDVAYAMDASLGAWDQECDGWSPAWQLTEPPEFTDLYDQRTTVFFEDPGGEVEVGVYATTYMMTGGDDPIVRDGLSYRNIAGADTIFNTDVEWFTDAAIADGTCTEGGVSFEAVLTHELGHLAGLSHTCEPDDACLDPVDRDATMYPTIATCSTAASSPEADDRLGIRAIYGPWLGVVCSGAGLDTGIADTGTLGVECAVTSEDAAALEDVSWTFSDGGMADGRTVSYTFASPGRYTITACGVLDPCGPAPTCDEQTFQIGPLPASDTGDTADSGGTPDSDDSPEHADAGCGCGAAGGGPALAGLVVAAGLVARRRRFPAPRG
jgi:MYXO-CTERM domain-containing protein